MILWSILSVLKTLHNQAICVHFVSIHASRCQQRLPPCWNSSVWLGTGKVFWDHHRGRVVISLEESAQHCQMGGVGPQKMGSLEIEEAVCRGVQGMDLGMTNEEGRPSTSRFFPTAAHMSSNRDFTIHGPGHLKNYLDIVMLYCGKIYVTNLLFWAIFFAFSCIALSMLTGLANTNSLHLPNLCTSWHQESVLCKSLSPDLTRCIWGHFMFCLEELGCSAYLSNNAFVFFINLTRSGSFILF